jgi:hypothetical protein
MAQAEISKNEDWAREKAQKILKASANDITHIVRFIKERVALIEDTIEDSVTRMTTIQEVCRNPHSGLSRTESNMIISKLFTLEAIQSRSRHSFRKQVPKKSALDMNSLQDSKSTSESEVSRNDTGLVVHVFLQAIL